MLSFTPQTRQGLHAAAQVLLIAQLAGLPPLSNAQRYGLTALPNGLTTRRLSLNGQPAQLTLDYLRLELVLTRGEEARVVAITGKSTRALLDALFDVRAELPADTVARVQLSERPLMIDANDAARYAEVQWRMYTALARLRARIIGAQTPLLVWAHGFDVSTIWFAGQTMEEHRDPHINFGFSPGTPDVGQPYVFFYATPVPSGLSAKLPAGMRWHTAWSVPGGVLPYDALTDNFEQQVTDTLFEVYETAAPLMV